jgi:hypothetical protein
MSKRGRPGNEDVNRAFKRFKQPGKETDTAECLSCGKQRAWNPTRLAEHLINCASYQGTQNENGESQCVPVMKKQATISLNAISPLQMLKIQKSLAFACYMDGLPFDAFEKFKTLPTSLLSIHGGLKFPSRGRIATKLLDGKRLQCAMFELSILLDGCC